MATEDDKLEIVSEQIVQVRETRKLFHRSRARCCPRRECRRPEVRRSGGLGIGVTRRAVLVLAKSDGWGRSSAAGS